MADTPSSPLVDFLRINLGKMVAKRGTRREVATLLKMQPPHLSRLLSGGQGWAAMTKLEQKLREAGFDTMEMLGPAPVLLELVDHIGPRDKYLIGRLLMLVGAMEPARRQRWLQNWVDAAELASEGPLPPIPE